MSTVAQTQTVEQSGADDMVFTAKGKGLTAIGQIKAKIASGLVKQGLPAKVYAVVFDRMPTEAELKEWGNPIVAEGTPIPSVKDGSIMYNLRGNGMLRSHKARVGGNTFLDLCIPPAYLEQYVAAKAEQDAARKRKQPATPAEADDEVLSQGESTE